MWEVRCTRCYYSALFQKIGESWNEISSGKPTQTNLLRMFSCRYQSSLLLVLILFLIQICLFNGFIGFSLKMNKNRNSIATFRNHKFHHSGKVLFIKPYTQEEIEREMKSMESFIQKEGINPKTLGKKNIFPEVNEDDARRMEEFLVNMTAALHNSTLTGFAFISSEFEWLITHNVSG